MRKTAILILLFNMYFSTLQSAVGLASIQNKDPEPPPRAVNITVDPRIELLAVVQFLSGYDERYRLITRFDFPYKQDVRDYFSPYKNHAAVELFDRMSAAGFSFDAPPAAMLYLSKPPELNAERPFTEYLNKRAGGAEQLKKFVELLRDFAEETEFAAFFKAHHGTFQHIVANAQEKMGSINYARTLQDYYGLSQNSYNIIPGTRKKAWFSTWPSAQRMFLISTAFFMDLPITLSPKAGRSCYPQTTPNKTEHGP